MKKRFLLFALPVSVFAGGLRAQTADSAGTPMQGELKEVEVLSPYTKWQEEAARNRLIYRKKLADAVFKPTLVPESLRVDGLINNLALKISGKKKRALKFKQEMERNEQEDFTSIRYSKAVVMQVTGLDDSAAVAFIKQNPMPRDILVTAKELEFLQWVRDRNRRQP